jgi:hypothetical protein
VTGYIKVNGVQKEIIGAYFKKNGVWKQGMVMSNKVNGVWKDVWTSAYDTPTGLTYPTTAQRGSSFTWTATAVSGSAYELQAKLGSGTWGASQFFTNNSNSYTVTTDVTINSLQLRVRTVDPTDHSKPSDWVTGAVTSLTPQKLATPTGFTVPTSITRGQKIHLSWNGLAGVSYAVEVYYKNSAGTATLATQLGVMTLAANGTTGIDYTVVTDTSKVKIYFKLKGSKTGYSDSDYVTSSEVTLTAQKLGAVTTMNVPTPVKGATITITWGSVTSAESYQLEVIYDNQTSFTRIYTGGTRSFNYTLPKDKGYVQFRVRATATNYAVGDWHYAWNNGEIGVKIQDPPLKNKTWTATWTGNWRPNFGGQWNNENNYVYQGKWTDSGGTWGNYKGMAIFNYQDIQNTLEGKDIEKVQLYFYRVNAGGYVAGQAITLYTHNYSSHPDGEPSYWFVQGPFSSFARGEGKWITVDNSVAERLRDGTAKGIGLYRSDGAGYLFMSTNVQLYVEYR